MVVIWLCRCVWKSKEDGLRHVIVRGWERRSIVRNDVDREDWIDKMRRRLATEPDDRIVPARRMMAHAVDAGQLRFAITDRFKVLQDVFTDVRERNNDARTAAIYLQRKLTSDSVTNLAVQYGGVTVAAISKAVSHAESRRLEDRNWHRILSQVQKALSLKY